MSTPLEKIIIQMIKDRGAEGFMRLDEYMSLCLSHPEYGYYMTRDPFGEAGDFTTAPEISQMFGEMVGVWLADTWMKMGSPKKIHLLECGAGRGTLMSDALRATKNIEGFHEAVHLHLLEISPILIHKQKEVLKAYNPTWHSDLESIPTDSPLLIIGNEFLDALPVRQFVFFEDGWAEKVVKLDINDTLRICEVEGNKEAKSLIPHLLIPPKLGDHIEVSLEQNDLISQISKIVLNQRGVGLFIDYGFSHTIAGDTLQALKNHKPCSLLGSPGDADITAHVNFANLTNEIMTNGVTVHGPVSQEMFLKALGIEVRAEILSRHASDKERVDLALGLKRLIGTKTDNKEMGALFKVIALTSDPSINLAGFS